tara:strand:- start:59 stop:484 length:426 start_codon:yes stop_codon:yes gene_type:complete
MKIFKLIGQLSVWVIDFWIQLTLFSIALSLFLVPFILVFQLLGGIPIGFLIVLLVVGFGIAGWVYFKLVNTKDIDQKKLFMKAWKWMLLLAALIGFITLLWMLFLVVKFALENWIVIVLLVLVITVLIVLLKKVKVSVTLK